MIVENEKSEPKNIKRGVPQGSNLSPILFNLMMADIPHSGNVLTMEYADDIAIAITAATIEEACAIARRTIRAFENWAKNSNLHFSPTKTKAMVFTKKTIQIDPTNDQQILPTLTVNGVDIEWKQELRYLGLTLDGPTLIWKQHINKIVKICTGRLNILRALTGTSWGADRNMILNMYKAFIRSKISYGITAVASASNTRLKKFERIQSAALRIVLGARKTSPIDSLQVEAGIPLH